MARISKGDVNAALRRAAANILDAAGDDPFVSRKDIRQKLDTLEGVEQSLTNLFYRFIDARDYKKGARVTKKDVDDAVAYAEEKLIAQYDLNNNGLSASEIEKMSTTGKLAVAFARVLKEQTSNGNLKTKQDWLERLGELSEGLVYMGYANEADTPLDPIYFEATLEELTKETFAATVGIDPSKPAEEITIYEVVMGLVEPERTFEIGGENGIARGNEINRFALNNLREFRSIVLGRDDGSMVEHPQYLIGLTETGAIAGYRHIVIWT